MVLSDVIDEWTVLSDIWGVVSSRTLANCSIMGATVSCCMSPGGSPKLARRAVELDDYPITTTGDDVSEDTGTYLQHISDREVPDGRCTFRISWSGGVYVMVTPL